MSATRAIRRRMAGATPYNTDPASARSRGGVILERSVFDRDRLLRALKAGLIEGIGPMDHPSDELLIATVIELGCPAWSADQMRYNPALRLAFYGMWVMVGQAAKGDREAKEIVDIARQSWDESRKAELVSDCPTGSIGIWDR